MLIERVEVKIAFDFIENCYLLSEGKSASQVVVVDPGAEPDRILKAVGERKLDTIILTHQHFDHTGAVGKLVKETGAKVVAHKKDAEAIINEIGKGPFSKVNKGESVYDFTLKRTVEDGDEIFVGKMPLVVMHTPGHTVGSMCLYNCASNSLLSGDTLFFEAVGRTDFPTGDAVAQKVSIQKLFTLPEKTVVYPGHDANTTIGHEKKYGPFAGLK